MTQMEIIKIADSYAPLGIRSTDQIECDMIMSDNYNLYGGRLRNETALQLIADTVYSSRLSLATTDDVNGTVDDYNWQLITEWAFTKLTEDMKPEEFESLTEQEIEELIADNERCFVDYLSYNGHLDDSFEVAQYLRGQQISCLCSIDDDCVYGVIFPRDGDDEVTLNHCQMVMFDSIYDYQEGDREIVVFNMGSKYVHLANY